MSSGIFIGLTFAFTIVICTVGALIGYIKRRQKYKKRQSIRVDMGDDINWANGHGPVELNHPPEYNFSPPGPYPHDDRKQGELPAGATLAPPPPAYAP